MHLHTKEKTSHIPAKHALLSSVLAIGLLAASPQTYAITITGPQLSGNASFGSTLSLFGAFVDINSIKYTGTTKPGPNDVHFTINWLDGNTTIRTSNYNFDIMESGTLWDSKYNMAPGESLPKTGIYLDKTSGGGSAAIPSGVQRLFFGITDDDRFKANGAKVSAYWTLNATPIPEPSNLMLMLLGLPLVAFAMRRKRAAAN